MMEQNNNTVQQTIDGMLDTMREEISKQVKQELINKGVTIIDNSYNGFQEVAKLMDSYSSKLEKLQSDIKYNEETYSDSVCKVKNYELHLDEEELKQDTMKALDETIEKTKKLQDRAIKDKQADPKYKEMKAEAMNIVSMLANVKDIPTEILLDVLDDVVGAGDIRTLNICKVLLQDNDMASYTVSRAIDEIRIAGENRELHAMVEVMKRYIEVGDNELSVMLWKNRVRGDK